LRVCAVLAASTTSSLPLRAVRAANYITPAVHQRTCTRSIKTLTFGTSKEEVVERTDFPPQKLKQLLGNDTFAVVGYGVQGRAQSLNLRDNGLKVVVGLREGGESWQKAQQDGWVPGKTLLPIEKAAAQGTTILYLLSDAGQKDSWNALKPHLTKGKTLYFSHGFSIVFKDQTGVIPPNDIDVILVAPKGSGTTVRSLFLEGKGINSSYAVFQDHTKHAKERAQAIGVAIGSGYLYETTFSKEVHSDLTGERGVLMGAIQGLFLAQYEVLREKGHSPSEASTKLLRRPHRVYIHLLATGAWTGCMPIAAQQHNVGRWTGHPSSTKPQNLCSKNCTRA